MATEKEIYGKRRIVFLLVIVAIAAWKIIYRTWLTLRGKFIQRQVDKYYK